MQYYKEKLQFILLQLSSILFNQKSRENANIMMVTALNLTMITILIIMVWLMFMYTMIPALNIILNVDIIALHQSLHLTTLPHESHQDHHQARL